MRRFWLLSLRFFASCNLAAQAAIAQDIPGYPDVMSFDPREVAMLPEYCKYTIYFRDKVPGGNASDVIQAWSARLGPTFLHIHHYCFGLMKTNRAVLLSRSEQVRLSYLNDSLHEFDYVLERAQPGFVLLPEILTKKAQNLARLGRGPSAVANWELAIEAKRDYWPAYADLSDYYSDTGQKERAREALERGLEATPDTPALVRRLKQLDSGPPVKTSTPGHERKGLPQ
jgi:tetratricopeptide (TPR) repeat protein